MDERSNRVLLCPLEAVRGGLSCEITPAAAGVPRGFDCPTQSFGLCREMFSLRLSFCGALCRFESATMHVKRERVSRCRVYVLCAAVCCLLGVLAPGLGYETDDRIAETMAPADIDEVPVQERRNNVEEQSEGIRLQTQRSAPHSGRSRGSFVSRRTSALTSKLRRNRKAIVMGVVGVAAVLAALYVARRWWTQKPREPGDSPPPEEPGDSPPRAGKPKAPSQPPTERRDVPTGVRQVGARDLPAPPASHTALLACLENRQIEFFGPSNSPHGFTPLYDPEPQKRVAMVDAGTNALFIGGAGVNGEVARLLTEEARRHEVRLTPEQLSEHSKRVQEDLLRLAVQHPRTLIELDTGARSPVFARSYGFVSVVPGTGWDESQTGRNVGATFIHILKDEVTPYGDPKNNAMVYTVAPSGNAPDASYSQAYQATIKGVVGAVSEFNRTPEGEQNPIEAIRMPFLGAGYFRGERDLQSIGRYNAVGTAEAVSQYEPTFDFQYMYDPSGALKDGFWHVEHQLWSGGKG